MTNDSVPMLGLIAVAVAATVGLYAYGVVPQGSVASDRPWLPSLTAERAYESPQAAAPAQQVAPAPTNGSPPGAPPPASDQSQYGSGQQPEYGSAQQPQYPGVQPSQPSDQAAPQQPQGQPSQPQYGLPAQ